MSTETIDVIDRLVQRHEWLAPLMRDHVADKFGEVLPDILLGEVTRLLVSEAKSGQDQEDGRRMEAK